MPRKPRLHFPGALYHVILRGNAKEDIFFVAEDRRRFLLFLQESMERFGFRFHGYCLMTNHVHLAIQVGEVPLSRIMQNLSLRYSWVPRAAYIEERSNILRSFLNRPSIYHTERFERLYDNQARVNMADALVELAHSAW